MGTPSTLFMAYHLNVLKFVVYFEMWVAASNGNVTTFAGPSERRNKVNKQYKHGRWLYLPIAEIALSEKICEIIMRIAQIL